MADWRDSFAPLDFVIFGLFLCVSVGVGVFFAWRARRRRMGTVGVGASGAPGEKGASGAVGSATDEFLMGSRKMPIVPVALSLLTTFLSGITLLGTPAEIYTRGTLFVLLYLSASVSFALAGLVFVPIFNQLKPVSVYEYFEHRFDSAALRKVASALFLVNSSFYMAVVVFSPAVALAGVTGIHEALWIAIVGLLCTLYCSIGGLKAVVWTDAIQAVFMYGGIIVMLLRGIHLSGGLSTVVDTFAAQGRLSDLGNTSVSPLQYNSLWIAMFGGTFYWLGGYGLNQMALQRYCSLPSRRHANIVLAMTVPMFIVLSLLASFVAVVMFAYFFQDCDPMLDPATAIKGDQLVILFAVRTLRAIPGMTGLFLATLFSATFSTVSSGINSQAAVVWQDFVRPHFGHRFTDGGAARLNRVLTAGFGALATAAAFSSGSIGGIIKACVSVVGATSGPLVGCFLLGMCVPWANKYGAFVGMAVGMLVNVVIAIGNIVYAPFKGHRMYLNDTCLAPENRPAFTDTYGDLSTPAPFRISIYLYTMIGVLLTVLIGAAVSAVWKGAALGQRKAALQRQLTVFRKGNVDLRNYNADDNVWDVQMDGIHKE